MVAKMPRIDVGSNDLQHENTITSFTSFLTNARLARKPHTAPLLQQSVMPSSISFQYKQKEVSKVAKVTDVVSNAVQNQSTTITTFTHHQLHLLPLRAKRIPVATGTKHIGDTTSYMNP